MTVQEAKSILVGFFIKNDCITNEQFVSLASKKTQPIESEAAFSYALEEMVTKDIVAKFHGVNLEGKPIFSWVLKRPIIFNSQTLEVDGQTALAVSNIVNDFFRQTGDKVNFSNPLQISQDDIHILMEIINMYAENNLNDEKKEEEKK